MGRPYRLPDRPELAGSAERENLFDKRYYSYIDEQHLQANHFGTPRSFLLTLRGQF